MPKKYSTIAFIYHCDTKNYSRSDTNGDGFPPVKKKKSSCDSSCGARSNREQRRAISNDNRELRQRWRERERERDETIGLVAEYNHFTWECNHLHGHLIFRRRR